MEIFIIVVAVIAVAAALILLVLLQIRIKKQTNAPERATVSQNASPAPPSVVEEIAADYPNDPFLKTGPPPYRQVMKSPELYPLSPTMGKGFGDVKIEIHPSCNERTRKTWSQFLNTVLQAEEQGPNTPPGKNIARDITPVSKDTALHNSSGVEDVLPTYYEVCGRPEPKVEICHEIKIEYCQRTFPRRDSADFVKSGYYSILGFNFGVEKTQLCQKDCVFTISNALQSVIPEEAMRPPSRPRLATL